MAASLRTFVAVEISDEIRQQAQALVARLDEVGAPVGWVDPANLHFTLQFLGDVETLAVPEICNAVIRGAAGSQSFEITCQGAGAFPTLARPRTLWLGVTVGEELFRQLHEAIEKELSALGFRPEGRKFHPHVTIGRVRGTPRQAAALSEPLAEAGDWLAGQMTVSRVAVFSSELTPTGPIYTKLGTARLD